MPDIVVVIPAGGRGRRLGVATPKQFLRLGGVPVLERTIGAFHALEEIGEIIVVVPAEYVPRTRTLVRRAGFSRVSAVVEGGRQRQASVFNGLAACTLRSGLVLVHDAARPLVDRRVIMGVIGGARRYGCAVAALRVKDTMKVEDPRGFFSRTLPREDLWAVQTPQGFRFELLWDAHRKALREGFFGTDEASLVERTGHRVRIVPGKERNIKITTPADRALAEFLLGTSG